MSLKPWSGSGLERSRRVRYRATHSLASTDFQHDPSAATSDPTLEMILGEFSDRWNRRLNPRAEDYLDRLSRDRQDDLVELIYHEYCLAEDAGLEPAPDEYLRRFPEVQEPLHRILLLHGTIDDAQLRDLIEDDDLPGVGDEIGPYLLVRKLGEGGFARVFLAEQADLDNRLVVVKVSRQITPEPQLLARARHPHIVEVLWHKLVENSSLQLICMPFLGGATLAAILADRGQRQARLTSGRDLLAILDRVAAPEYPRPEMDRPARETLARQSYPRAVAWIIARLAEALDHASARGVAHGDVKPSNILLTADGVPMLLDFNLAVGWQYPAGAEKPGEPGGTLIYMAPERLRGVADPSRSEPPRAATRHRADIYSLGMVLLEALTGHSPEIPKLPPRSSQAELAATYARSRDQGGEVMIRAARTSISPALRSILARCLAPDPADRYKRGAELADDLDRWRTDRPLAFAKEPTWRLGLVRCARRKRLALTAAALSLTVAMFATLAVSNVYKGTKRQHAEAKLAHIWDRDDGGAFRFHRVGHWRPDQQGDPAENALRHLEFYGVTGPGDWRQRDDVRYLSEDDRADLEVWLLEQILRYTRALGERADSPSDWRRGLALLERTVVLMPLAPLMAQAHILAERLGLPDPAPGNGDGGKPAMPPRWMEEYLLGVEAEGTRDQDAKNHFFNVLSERPQSIWAHYRTAALACRSRKFEDATDHLEICIARRPENPILHGLLAGCLFELLNRYDKTLEESKRASALLLALDECNKALALDPDQAESYRTRTYIRAELGQGESLDLKSDISRFEILMRHQGKAPSLRLRLDSLIALGLDGPSGQFDALSRRLLDIDPEDSDLRTQLALDLWIAGRHDDALSELDEVLRRDSDHLKARLMRATLHQRYERPEGDRDFAFLLRSPRREDLLCSLERLNDVRAIDSFVNLSRASVRLGDTRDAILLAERGLATAYRIKREQGPAHSYLGHLYKKSSKSDPHLVGLAQEHERKAKAFPTREPRMRTEPK